ncbi:hypothetical protein [Marinovum algicola]|uniref:hypothetical protein n=1 Tax=Marinovum algicola TaxID=42444 RepID=UPI003B51B161
MTRNPARIPRPKTIPPGGFGRGHQETDVRPCTVTLCPPDYPDRFEPFDCPHDPAMQICDAGISWAGSGRSQTFVRHARCLACGAPVGSADANNIFVDIAALLDLEICAAGPLRTRLLVMRKLYLRRAEILFGPDGWLGDESWRELAEMIDPNLTMRVIPAGSHGDGTRFVRVHFDASYLPPEAEPEQMRLL